VADARVLVADARVLVADARVLVADARVLVADMPRRQCPTYLGASGRRVERWWRT
jgi:hypothetical protein